MTKDSKKSSSKSSSSPDSGSKSSSSSPSVDVPAKKKTKPKSSDETKSKDKKKKSHEKSSAKSQVKSKSSQGHRSKSKESKKSTDGHKSKKSKSADRSADASGPKAKPKGEHKKEKKSKKHSKDRKKQGKGSEKSTQETCSASKLLHANSIGREVRKIEACKGATSVTSEETIRSDGFVILADNIFRGEYSQVFRAKHKSFGSQLAVKMVTLADCSPRLRTNLLLNSTRIMRYTGGADQPESDQPLSPLFLKIYDMFVIGGAKLFVFMAVSNSTRLMYDLVKSKDKQSPVNIRIWTKAIASGVDHLQRIGVAHRGIKLQHILLDRGNPKLCGWNKSVLYYDPHKQRILKQRKERRVRHNYYMPPEAFLGSYDPSKGDIWSIGIILVSMSTKRYPFNVRDGKTKFSSQWREFIKKHELNTFVRNLCHKLFIIDPNRRITSKDVLKDKYFTVSEENLAKISCTADLRSMREDSRVGGMSAIEFTNPQPDKSPGSKKEATKKTKTTVQPEQEEPEQEEEDWAQQEKDDQSGMDENATGEEGGTVGAEEDNAQEDESQMAENAAPEEAENEAQPVEGDEAVAEEEAPDDEAEGEAAEEADEAAEAEGDAAEDSEE